ncbi:CBS domain-containing protein [Pseudorhodobacter wandonensis]|uniref:CBS domain-containing protein n=1 Tax=Pseudorhodobacter wandonensis TaxID=1120568 RepID=UPI00067C3C41|nr:CBS domain-containing protein [Pseudorhodobacter wandonensis]
MTAQTLHSLLQTNTPSLTPDMPIRRAVALLVQHNLPAAAVLDDSGALRGILSQKDCFRPALNASYYQEWKGTVADYMTENPTTLAASSDILTAAQAFQTYPYRVFPVLEGERFLGLLTRTAVLKRLVEQG